MVEKGNLEFDLSSIDTKADPISQNGTKWLTELLQLLPISV